MSDPILQCSIKSTTGKEGYDIVATITPINPKGDAGVINDALHRLASLVTAAVSTSALSSAQTRIEGQTMRVTTTAYPGYKVERTEKALKAFLAGYTALRFVETPARV